MYEVGRSHLPPYRHDRASGHVLSSKIMDIASRIRSPASVLSFLPTPMLLGLALPTNLLGPAY